MSERQSPEGLPRPIKWTRQDYSRVPFAVFHDPELYQREMQRVFGGPAWQFLGFAAEIPKPGDFRTAFLGETPVVYNRDMEGGIHAFVNRCAHRGSVVRREPYGNAKDHVCIYHQWCYGLDGSLLGVPFQRGLAGQGGLPADFKRSDHGLRRLRIENFRGALFANFDDAAAPLEDYLGEEIGGWLARLLKGEIRILGYQRQFIRGNWKLYAENSRDQYHGSLLHRFQGALITRTVTEGGLRLDPRHRHSLIYSMPGRKALEVDSARVQEDVVHDIDGADRLRRMTMLRHIDEYGDGVGSAICSLFPGVVFQRIRNSLATRVIRPKGLDAFELHWTLFGFADDSEELGAHRLLQANIGGPAGYVSLEDGEAIELVHNATKQASDEASLLEMGGIGPIPEHVTTRMNELSVRGFWSYYAELMGEEPEGGIR